MKRKEAVSVRIDPLQQKEFERLVNRYAKLHDGCSEAEAVRYAVENLPWGAEIVE